MKLAPKGGQDHLALPRLHHWMIAAVLIFMMTLIVPVVAGLT